MKKNETTRDQNRSDVRQMWVPARVALSIIGHSEAALRRLAQEGIVRTHRLPGGRPRYCRADLEKLAPPTE